MAKAKMVEGLDCDQRALEGMRRVLFTRLDEMCELRAAALDWSDIEGVHDMRVASRRLRSLLKDFRPYFHGQIRQKRLRELARSLGMVRDQDVAIEALHKLAAEVAPEDVAQGLGRIIHERERRRERARKNLAESISEDDLADLRDKLALTVSRGNAQHGGRTHRARRDHGRSNPASNRADLSTGGPHHHPQTPCRATRPRREPLPSFRRGAFA